MVIKSVCTYFLLYFIYFYTYNHLFYIEAEADAQVDFLEKELNQAREHRMQTRAKTSKYNMYYVNII